MRDVYQRALVAALGVGLLSFCAGAEAAPAPACTTGSGAVTDFAYSGSLVYCTIPVTGAYVIDASGANGGAAYWASGGTSLYIHTIDNLQAGNLLEILVGGEGTAGSLGSGLGVPGGGGGGGGGTFVDWAQDASQGATKALLLAAAGGGGGAGYHGNPGGNAIGAGPSTGDIAGSGTGNNGTASAGGTGGSGGAFGDTAAGGAGGGGYAGGGQESGTAYGGGSFKSGAAGGTENPPGVEYGGAGGFGGGGAGGSTTDGEGGGGGGYSGGGGGGTFFSFSNPSGGAGGGGNSYVDTTYVSSFYDFNLSTGNGNGNGIVAIEQVPASFLVPEPASLLVLASGVTALGVMRRRTRTASARKPN